jgi:hypothetical protein
MAKTKTTPAMQAEMKNRLDDWITRVRLLCDQIATWSAAEGWEVEQHEKDITEDRLGRYAVPELLIRLDGGELLITPVARDTIGGEGRVDPEAIPTLARVKIVGVNGGWKLYADPNVPLRIDWNHENFAQLALDLLS